MFLTDPPMSSICNDLPLNHERLDTMNFMIDSGVKYEHNNPLLSLWNNVCYTEASVASFSDSNAVRSNLDPTSPFPLPNLTPVADFPCPPLSSMNPCFLDTENQGLYSHRIQFNLCDTHHLSTDKPDIKCKIVPNALPSQHYMPPEGLYGLPSAHPEPFNCNIPFVPMLPSRDGITHDPGVLIERSECTAYQVDCSQSLNSSDPSTNSSVVVPPLYLCPNPNLLPEIPCPLTTKVKIPHGPTAPVPAEDNRYENSQYLNPGYRQALLLDNATYNLGVYPRNPNMSIEASTLDYNLSTDPAIQCLLDTSTDTSFTWYEQQHEKVENCNPLSDDASIFLDSSWDLHSRGKQLHSRNSYTEPDSLVHNYNGSNSRFIVSPHPPINRVEDSFNPFLTASLSKCNSVTQIPSERNVKPTRKGPRNSIKDFLAPTPSRRKSRAGRKPLSGVFGICRQDSRWVVSYRDDQEKVRHRYFIFQTKFEQLSQLILAKRFLWKVVRLGRQLNPRDGEGLEEFVRNYDSDGTSEFLGVERSGGTHSNCKDTAQLSMTRNTSSSEVQNSRYRTFPASNYDASAHYVLDYSKKNKEDEQQANKDVSNDIVLPVDPRCLPDKRFNHRMDYQTYLYENPAIDHSPSGKRTTTETTTGTTSGTAESNFSPMPRDTVTATSASSDLVSKDAQRHKRGYSTPACKKSKRHMSCTVSPGSSKMSTKCGSSAELAPHLRLIHSSTLLRGGSSDSKHHCTAEQPKNTTVPQMNCTEKHIACALTSQPTTPHVTTLRVAYPEVCKSYTPLTWDSTGNDKVYSGSNSVKAFHCDGDDSSTAQEPFSSAGRLRKSYEQGLAALHNQSDDPSHHSESPTSTSTTVGRQISPGSNSTMNDYVAWDTQQKSYSNPSSPFPAEDKELENYIPTQPVLQSIHWDPKQQMEDDNTERPSLVWRVPMEKEDYSNNIPIDSSGSVIPDMYCCSTVAQDAIINCQDSKATHRPSHSLSIPHVDSIQPYPESHSLKYPYPAPAGDVKLETTAVPPRTSLQSACNPRDVTPTIEPNECFSHHHHRHQSTMPHNGNEGHPSEQWKLHMTAVKHKSLNQINKGYKTLINSDQSIRLERIRCRYRKITLRYFTPHGGFRRLHVDRFTRVQRSKRLKVCLGSYTVPHLRL